jgi:CO/xanthine dehydrogenase FAD-binding subunit
MRSFLPDYQLRQATSLADALAVLTEAPGMWRPFAGGTDLMVLLEAAKLPPGRYLSIWGLDELRGIAVDADAVSLGALTTYTDILRSDVLQTEFPLLCRAAAETGGVATQNRGTIGGNIANASPAADTPPALLVYDAELDIVSMNGRRRVRYDAFHRGYKQMDLKPNELIAAVRLPRGRAAWVQSYRKVGPRRAQAISKVCLAAAATTRGGVIDDIRIALGSVAPVPLRAVKTEQVLRGHPVDDRHLARAVEALASEVSPIDDLRSSARYRSRVARNLLVEFLRSIEPDRRRP